MVVSTILTGLLSGVSRSLIGYVRNLPQPEKSNDINWAKAAPALITGGVIGIYSAYAGINLLQAETFMASTGLAYVVGEAWGFACNWYKNKKLLSEPKPKKK